MAKGGILGDVLEGVSDIVATATGNPELIPLINAGESTITGLASGQPLGKSLIGGLESGGEALAGQEVAGAFGLGNGNSLLNNALGVDISPSATGLPDIGSALGLGSTPTTNPVSGATGATPGGVPVAGTAAPTTGSVTPGAAAPGGPGDGAAGISAPASVGGPPTDVTSLFNTTGAYPTGVNGAGTAFSSGAGGTGTDVSSLFAPNSGSSALSNVVAPAPTIPNVPGVTSNAGLPGGPPPSSVSIPGAGVAGTNVSGAGGGAAAGPSSVSQFLSNPSLSGLGNILSKNAGSLVPAAGVGLESILGSQSAQDEGKIGQAAGQLAGQGASLESYIQSGNLPPGLQASLDQASAAAAATIKSQYAARGMSGSSAEAQDLANLQQTIAAQGASYAMNLLNTGISETGAASQLYENIMQASINQDQALASSLTNFGAALAGGGNTTLPGGISINIPRTGTAAV